MVYTWLRNTLDLLYPPVCVLCGDRFGVGGFRGLCPGCRGDLPEGDLACPVCGIAQPRAERCGACRKRPPAQDSLWAAHAYRFPLDTLLKGYKYRYRMPQGRVLQDLFLEAALGAAERDALALPDLLIPVPLPPAKLRERGFNQSLELAKPVAKALGLRIDHRLVRRVRATPSQAGLPPTSRARNVRKAFRCDRSVAGRAVAIVDDVVTTGSTVGEVTKTLKRAGAARVAVWTLARTQADW